MKSKVLVFMPSIEGGGVEKNFFIVCNYLVIKLGSLKVITISKGFKKKFDKSVTLITPSSSIWDRFSRRIKYLIAIFLLIKEIIKNKNTIVFSFQANIYCILICKLFSIKIITKKQLKVNSKCIYNPLNRKEIIKKSKQKSKKIFSSSKKLKILNIGRFTEQKDQLTFLKSLNNLKNKIDFEACIIGRGVLKKKLQNYISQNNLGYFVKIIDFVKNPYPLIKQSNLFILTSKFEGLPNVLLESLTLKKFVISSNCHTGPKEILLNGKGGLLFKVGNYRELSKKIRFYSMNKKDCGKMINRSYKALDRFDYSKNLRQYEEMVRSLI